VPCSGRFPLHRRPDRREASNWNVVRLARCVERSIGKIARCLLVTDNTNLSPRRSVSKVNRRHPALRDAVTIARADPDRGIIVLAAHNGLPRPANRRQEGRLTVVTRETRGAHRGRLEPGPYVRSCDHYSQVAKLGDTLWHLTEGYRGD